LGNVLETISDKKIQHTTDNSTVDYYLADVIGANDYYSFGMQQPGRGYSAGSAANYPYGFNGKEDDNEVKGNGDQIDYGMRTYDPRVGKFLSVDPLQKHFADLTPYQYANNTPIQALDLDGKEPQGYMQYWEERTNEYMTKWGYTVQDFYDYKTNQVWTVMNYPNTDEYYYWQSKSENDAHLFSPINTNLNKDENKEWTGKFKQFIPHYASEAAQESADILAEGFAALVAAPFVYAFGAGAGSEAIAAFEGNSAISQGILSYYRYAPLAGAAGRGVAGFFDESGSVSLQNSALQGMAKGLAYSYASELFKTTPKGSLPRAVTAIVDLKTGKSFFGTSGSLEEGAINPALKELLPKESLEAWKVHNCAECDALNKALNAGSKLEDLEMHTVKISSTTGKLEDFTRCQNCRITTKDVKTTSDK
jgi:RHS repeat-associated protein